MMVVTDYYCVFLSKLFPFLNDSDADETCRVVLATHYPAADYSGSGHEGQCSPGPSPLLPPAPVLMHLWPIFSAEREERGVRKGNTSVLDSMVRSCPLIPLLPSSSYLFLPVPGKGRAGKPSEVTPGAGGLRCSPQLPALAPLSPALMSGPQV